MRAALFDLDGTLADTMPVCFDAFRAVFLEELGREWTNAEIQAHFGPSEEGVLKSVLGAAREAEATERYLDHYARLHRAVPGLFDGIERVIARCRDAGMRRGIVTGKGPRSARISAEQLGLDAHFEVLEAGSSAGWQKIARLETILDAWGLAGADGFYVGDHPSDVRAARELGLVALSAAWCPLADVDALRRAEPDALFETPAEMVRWLDERLG
ncbi:MAG: HAD family hydrolase [Planctomycetes bacterium]|nr:HAD family hydrolase [Planctomycetota bacterium]MCB9917098.1 HAD family hydrolase [Planctomycetota bacterium]